MPIWSWARMGVVRLFGQAGLTVHHFGVPFDVFWLRLSRRSTDPDQTGGRFNRGKALVMLNRRDYWQCGYVIPKGTADQMRQRGLEADAATSSVPTF